MARKTALGWGRHPANLANKTGPKAAPKAVQANSTRSKIDVGADKEIPTAKTIFFQTKLYKGSLKFKKYVN